MEVLFAVGAEVVPQSLGVLGVAQEDVQQIDDDFAFAEVVLGGVLDNAAL